MNGVANESTEKGTASHAAGNALVAGLGGHGFSRAAERVNKMGFSP
jgi:hypothetical protein